MRPASAPAHPAGPPAAAPRRPARSRPQRSPRSRPASGRWPAGSRWPARRSRRPPARLGDEEHVDVADVVELEPPALAHGDHGQPARLGRRSGSSPRAIARAASSVASPARRAPAAVGSNAGETGEVPRRDHQQPPPVGLAQGLVARPVSTRAATGSAASGAAPTAASSSRRTSSRGSAARRGTPSTDPVVGVAREVVAQRDARAQHRHQPVEDAGRRVEPGRRSAPPGRGRRPPRGRRTSRRESRGRDPRAAASVEQQVVIASSPARAWSAGWASASPAAARRRSPAGRAGPVGGRRTSGRIPLRGSPRGHG